MSYGDDFPLADAPGAPLDSPLLIGADAVVWGGLLLGFAAAVLLGWYLGARSTARRGDAAEGIWRAINEAARSAMGADDNALKGRAEALLRVIDSRLGRTLGLIGGLSVPVGQMRDAVHGRRPSDGHANGPGAASPAPAHDAPGDHPDARPAAAPAVTIVNVHAGPAPGTASGHGHGAGGPGLTQREQTDALRLAVAAFNQHWRDESARIGDLRAACAELSAPGPGRTPTGRISGTRARS